MDMRISGSGVITAGEYEGIRISGSARMTGVVHCESLRVAGSLSGETVECRNDMRISGGSRFSANVKANDLRVAGSLSCGALKCVSLVVAGVTSVGGDVEAENVKVDGALACEGLLNAEEIEIKFEKGMTIGSIGGSKIVIMSKHRMDKKIRLPLFHSISNQIDKGGVHVKNTVEGDEIALEGVRAESVSGRTVAIGDGCEIGLVRYSETIEISPNAKVGEVEKIDF